MSLSDKYSDIIHLSYQKSKQRPPMLNSHRAAQFAPFAALTGHDMAVREVARLTVDKIELDESSINKLNEKIQLLKKTDNLTSHSLGMPFLGALNPRLHHAMLKRFICCHMLTRSTPEAKIRHLA